MINVMNNPISTIDISLQNIIFLNCAFTNIMHIENMPKINKLVYSSYQESVFTSYTDLKMKMILPL